MNFLGHAVLSFKDPEILLGNMIADYVKGKMALNQFPERVQKGILLHRKIDEFTDHHPQTLKLKIYFRPDYRLYAGPCVDHLYDHFLANDPYYFPDQSALLAFEAQVYTTLASFSEYFPTHFSALFPHMQEGKWLSDVKKIKGLKRSFERLERRAQYMPDSLQAYQISVGHYYEMNQRFFDFMEDLNLFVKNEFKSLS